MDQALLDAVPADRRAVHILLMGLTENLYFQAPPNTGMSYPCILYALDDIRTEHADNLPYRSNKRYTVTVIDEDPDSSLRDQVSALPSSSFERYFTADDLNHYVFNMTF